MDFSNQKNATESNEPQEERKAAKPKRPNLKKEEPRLKRRLNKRSGGPRTTEGKIYSYPLSSLARRFACSVGASIAALPSLDLASWALRLCVPLEVHLIQLHFFDLRSP